MTIKAQAAKVQAIQQVRALSECKVTAISAIAVLIYVQGGKFDSVSFQASLVADSKGAVTESLAKRLTNNGAKLVASMGAEIADALKGSADEKAALADLSAMLKKSGLTTQKALEGKLFPNRGKGTGAGGRPKTAAAAPQADAAPQVDSAPAPSKTPLDTACDLAATLSNDDLLKLAAKVQALMTAKGMLVTTSPKRPAKKAA